jgi:hypothetical protein
MMLGVAASRLGGDAGVNVRVVVAASLFYALLAVWFIWLGIGSILARRWARAVILVSSWLWLAGGLAGTLCWLLLSPGMYEQIGMQQGMPRTVLTIMQVVTGLFLALIYVVVPGVLILFYRSRHVRATCEALDPKPRWTDRCPLPVLALVLMYGLAAVCTLMVICYRSVMPFFGTLLSGTAGTAALIACSGFFLFLARGLYRRRMAAWWAALAATATMAVSVALTLTRISLVDWYDAMGFSEQQLEVLEAMEQTGLTSTTGLYMGVWFAALLIYFLCVRRYFASGASAAPQRP